MTMTGKFPKGRAIPAEAVYAGQPTALFTSPVRIDETGEPIFRQSLNCPARREGDEVVCPTCGLRWSLGEDRPECPR